MYEVKHTKKKNKSKQANLVHVLVCNSQRVTLEPTQELFSNRNSIRVPYCKEKRRKNKTKEMKRKEK